MDPDFPFFCSDNFCDGHALTSQTCEPEPCCENYVILGGDLMGNDHCHECPEYDGAPVERWEVTEPRDVYTGYNPLSGQWY